MLWGLVKEESHGFTELFKDLLQPGVVFPKNDGHEVHLAVHLPLGSPYHELLTECS